MKATAGDLPLNESDWLFEIKWDGMRGLAFCEQADLRMQSANKLDVTMAYPELQPLAASTGVKRAVFDGEIVALDEHERPDFGLLQQRMHVSLPAEALARSAQVPVQYQLFDLLHLDGHDLLGLPVEERRRLLEDLVAPGAAWRVPSASRSNGHELLEAAAGRGLEGLVAKQMGSTYQPGKRSRSWRKIKVRRRQEFVVGAWSPGEGSRANVMGSLLVGTYQAESLVYAGKVGTGFTQGELDRLDTRLRSLEVERCPFQPPPPRADARSARWMRPEMVIEVAFAEWTHDGRLRHPSYLGERTDKPASEVGREGP